MGTVKILLLTVLPTVVLGCIVGVVLGKYQVKKARRQLRSFLSTKQRIAYSASIAIGVACVLLGIFLPAPDPLDMGTSDNDMYVDNGGMAVFDDTDTFTDFNKDEEIQFDGKVADDVTDEVADNVDVADGVDSEESMDTDIAVKEPVVANTKPANPSVARVRGGDVAVAIMR